MREITVRTTRETEVPVGQLHELRKAAFRQWEEAGLDASEANGPIESFARSLSVKTVFVAHDAATGELLAMHTLRLDRRRRTAAGSNLAVAPHAKNEGIASRMLQAEAGRLGKAGYRYMSGSTAILATWSVRWHLRNGYLITGYKRSEKKNYASYTFRKPLVPDIRRHPQDILWTRPVAPLTARLYYIASYLVTCLCKTRGGQLTAIGRMAKRMTGK